MTILDGFQVLSISEVKELANGRSPAVQAALKALAIALLNESAPLYSVKLVSIGYRKIDVVKAVRVLRADLGLKETADLIDTAPVIILKDLDEKSAVAASSRLRDVGATPSMAKQE